jgi:hypothetical protein
MGVVNMYMVRQILTEKASGKKSNMVIERKKKHSFKQK